MEKKTLVILESPGKIKTVEKYLGPEYKVCASYGHIMDLDKKTLSIDIENNYKPNYIISEDKHQVVRSLRYIAKNCKEVIIASDMDREGEKIGADVATILKLKNPKRLVFHEITKSSMKHAIENPSTINYDMVYAQQARRLLDRLVGYKISPVLWKYTRGGTSAGRVQSVVVRVIVDKENDINNSISNPYFKTTAKFKFKKTTFNSVLNQSNRDKNKSSIYHFKSYKKALKFIKKINQNTVFKVVDVFEKQIERKAPAPFTTSTLQQDASTKLRFNVKRTMMTAQKLYEAGLITYMRTDSVNMSKDAMGQCSKYIIDKYGQKYSQPKNITKKSKGAQEAHECIRPTKISLVSASQKMKNNNDAQKLYQLIWKRTVASQMSNAIINLQTILIDALNKVSEEDNRDEPVLPKRTNFQAILETIIFDGYLILYNNKEDKEDVEKGKIKIKKDNEVEMKEIKISEEYTKPPLRYNEAGLVRFLEKKGIGRPSTYASIISKIVDRKYVVFKDIEGVKKESKIILLNNKYKLKESKKEITIGKEKNKLTPTEQGITISQFLIKNFGPIMEIDYTAKFEKFLDKIAQGKAKWATVLDNYYKMFSPMVVKLMEDAKHLTNLNQTDTLVGKHPDSGLEIYSGNGKYGPYVKILKNDKWKYVAVKDKGKMTLEKAVKLLEFPICLGKIGKDKVYLHQGKFGYYLKKGKDNMFIKDKKIDLNDIDLDYAKKLYESGDPYSLKSFNVKGKKINLKKGPYGLYLQIVSKKNKTNISINNLTEDDIDLEKVLEILAKKYGTIKV